MGRFPVSGHPTGTAADGDWRPVLKITQRVLIGLENFLLYLIVQGLSRARFCSVLIGLDPF